MRVQARVTTQSDWAVGSGYGQPGGADRLVVRDSEGLPFVPARTFRGLLRSSAEDIAAALDDGSVAGWKRAVARLFGERLTGRAATPGSREPTASLIRVGALHLDPNLRAALLDPDRGPSRRAQLTAIRAAVRIDGTSGTADDRHLRFEEVVRSGLHLSGAIQIDENLSDEDAAVVLALLTLAARATTYLGGSRRRGLGRIDCKLEPGMAAASVREALDSGPPSLERSRAEATPRITTVPLPQQPRARVRLDVTAIEPLVLPVNVQGNVVRSSAEIPGRTLLPLVSEALGGLVDVRMAFRGGALSVSHARVSLAGLPARPIPLCLAWPKLGGEGPRRALNQAAPAEPDEVLLGTQYRSAKPGEYVVLARQDGQQHLWVTTVDRGMATHNVIDPEHQRPDQEAGGVYSYETVLPGTQFCAEVRVTPDLADEVLTRLRSALAGDRWIGSVRNAGYGRVRVAVGTPVSVEAPSAGIPAGTPFLVIADSPIVCGSECWPNGPTAMSWLTTLNEAVLAAGADGQTRLDADPISGRAVWMRTQTEHSWHAGWGLPRRSVGTVSAGSVLRLVATHDLAPDVIGKVTDRGIGARTAEGYGEVRFQPAELRARSLSLKEWVGERRDADRRQALIGAPITEPSPELQWLIEDLDRRVHHDQILAAALDHARNPQFATSMGWTSSPPTRSQLSSLRAAASVTNSVRQSIMSWLNHVRDIEARRQANGRKRRWTDPQLDAVEQLVGTLVVTLADQTDPETASVLGNSDEMADLVVATTVIEAVRIAGRHGGTDGTGAAVAATVEGGA